MTTAQLDKIRIVLSHTSHAGNIGAAARAMKTMGLQALYLVNPESFPDKKAHIRAVSARDLLAQAQVCSTLDEALEDTVLAAALTTRSRKLEHEAYDARSGAKILLQHAQQHPVALVFGPETSGLTVEEASKCAIKIAIPTNPEYSSLNLASAVQVMAYELRMALPEIESSPFQNEPAKFDDIEFFYKHLEQVMIQTDFLDPEQPRKLMQRIRRLFSRARLEQEEVKILRGILTAVEKQLSEKR